MLRVDSPSCVSSSPAQAIPECSRTPCELGPASLPEPMAIAVEASPGTGMEGRVSVVCMPAQQTGDLSESRSHQDLDIVDIPAPQQRCLTVGSRSQLGQDGQAGNLRIGSPGLSNQDQEVADRLRAAVCSRGFEPCPGSDKATSPEEAPASHVDSTSCDTAEAASVSQQGPRPMVLCHADAGVLHWQSKFVPCHIVWLIISYLRACEALGIF